MCLHCSFFADLKEVNLTRSDSCNGLTRTNISDVGIRYGFGFKDLRKLKISVGDKVINYIVNGNITVGLWKASARELS